LLREHKLYAKFSKCDFFQKRVHYLGHVNSEEGVEVDPEKIKVIMNWPTTNYVTEVRSFMGLAGYYKISAQWFSNIGHPTLHFRKKGMKFVWKLDCEASFQ